MIRAWWRQPSAAEQTRRQRLARVLRSSIERAERTRGPVMTLALWYVLAFLAGLLYGRWR